MIAGAHASHRAAELARTRAGRELSEEDCFIWFGVSRAVLERIESGEIIPSDEVAAKIDRYLDTIGGRA